MCGIAGIFSTDKREVSTELLGRMTRLLRHRGPDDEGYLLIDAHSGNCQARSGEGTCRQIRSSMLDLRAPTDPQFDMGLGHRRLSIIDLSPAGHQPMCNEDGTLWILHNGEVYNHFELRQELEAKGHAFQSRTDTEVILHAYEEWGPASLTRFNGMWAFAIWDSRSRKLFCSRDRFGIKPFYYYFDGQRFLFASEIKSILEADFVESTPAYPVVLKYLANGIVDDAEDTFFAGIKHLPGGHFLEFLPASGTLHVERFYTIPTPSHPVRCSDEDCARTVRSLLEDSIQKRLMSDVPLGSCLSGGIDSSSIVCVVDRLMRDKGLKLPGSDTIQKTFSARYRDSVHDEGAFISQVVEATHVDAYNTYPTPEGLQADLPRLVWHQEEPFLSTSIYAQWEVFKLFKQQGVKVALDGQGSDEMLAGYNWSFVVLFHYLLRSLQLPSLLTECYHHTRTHGPSATTEIIALSCRSVLAKFHRRRITWLNESFSAGLQGPPAVNAVPPSHALHAFDRYLYDGVSATTVPSLLRYEDKNSMAHSVESRVPFLDYHLVEYVLSLPWQQKIRHATTKYVLRNAMRGIVPQPILDRQDKIGFSTPQDRWFRASLRDDVTEIIGSKSFQDRPFFDMKGVRQEFEAHQQGIRNASVAIWKWINLELWMRTFVDRKRTDRQTA